MPAGRGACWQGRNSFSSPGGGSPDINDRRPPAARFTIARQALIHPQALPPSHPNPQSDSGSGVSAGPDRFTSRRSSGLNEEARLWAIGGLMLALGEDEPRRQTTIPQNDG